MVGQRGITSRRHISRDVIILGEQEEKKEHSHKLFGRIFPKVTIIFQEFALSGDVVLASQQHACIWFFLRFGTLLFTYKVRKSRKVVRSQKEQFEGLLGHDPVQQGF